MKKMAISMMVFCSLMALSAAAWCGDNGNGTVTISGGLVVLKDAGCLGYMSWDNALARAKAVAHGQCGLSDNSKAGDWRLPTVAEFNAMRSDGTLKNIQSGDYWLSSGKTASFGLKPSPCYLTPDSCDGLSNYVLTVRARQ